MKNSFFNKKTLKAGGYTVIVCVIAVIIFIAVNLIVKEFPDDKIQLDMTPDGYTDLTKTSEEYIKGIESDISIYMIATASEYDTDIKLLIDKMVSANNKLKFEIIDPSENPAFLKLYTGITGYGDLIVESEKRYKVITSRSVYYPGMSDEEYAYYSYYGQMPEESFDAENCLLSAFDYVTTDVFPTAYKLKGHGEADFSSSYSTYISQYNIEMNELELLAVGSVPEDCDCLVINAPKIDITKNEAELILDYLKKGGKLLLTTEWSLDTKFENLLSVTEYYGATLLDGIVVETADDAHYPDSKTIIFPTVNNYEYTENMIKAMEEYSNIHIWSVQTQAIGKIDGANANALITPLLTTSDKAYRKTDINTEAKTDEEFCEKTEACVDGQYDLAVAITNSNEDGSETKIIWMASPCYFDDNFYFYSSGLDGYFALESLSNLTGKVNEVRLAENKNMDYSLLNLTALTSKILIAIFLGIIPLTVLATGIVVVVRRRKR